MVDKARDIKAILAEALDISDPEARSRYLREACGDDVQLRKECESLLQMEGKVGDMLEVPLLDSGLGLNGPPMNEGPGSTIGRYKLLEKIGEGGMAVVYMAEQERPLRRKVALKIIKLGMDTKQVIARFEAERQALALMDHPNIARVFDGGTTDTGRPYFVMELVRGVTITEYCDQNRLSTDERLRLFAQVSIAVQHAHQKGIIHRDIKPSNIMVAKRDGTPVPKVIDFGIAKATNQKLTEKTLFTRYAHIIGTPAYMSPEQAELSELDIDTRSDIYSLGVLLYELLTGTTPFSEEELRKAGYVEMTRVIREQEPDKPSTKLTALGEMLTDIAKQRNASPDVLLRSMRGDLDWIVMKTLEKDRSRRYETASELAMDIKRHLDDEPILAHAPGPLYHLQKFLCRHRVRIAALLALIVLMGSLVMTLSTWNENQRQHHQSLLSKAHDAQAEGDSPGALRMLEPILNSRHVGSEARLLHARLVLDQQGPVAAVQELEALLNDRDGISDEIAGQAHWLLAEIYYNSDPDAPGQTEECFLKWKQHKQKATELLPENADAYLLQARSAGTVSQTLKFLDRALTLEERHYEVLRERAYLSYVVQDFMGVLKDTSTMIGIRSRHAPDYSLRAMAQRELKYFNDGIEDHNQALELAPNDPELYYQRHQTYMRMGYYTNALQDMQTCVRLDPNEYQYHLQMFCTLTALGRYDEARTEYDELVASERAKRPRFLDKRYVKYNLDRYVSSHVFDMLHAGRPWCPEGNPPTGPQFWRMFEAAANYRQWDAKAQRIVSNGFGCDWSPDGNLLVYSLGFQGSSGIAIWNRVTGETRLLTIPGRDPVWSPDGQTIAYVRDRQILPVKSIPSAHRGLARHINQEEIWLIKASGTEEPEFLVKGGFPQWSRDSHRIFFRPPRSVGKLCSISPSGNDVQPLMLCPGSAPVISPYERYVANQHHNCVQIRELNSGKLVAQWLAPPEMEHMRLSWSSDERTLSMGTITDWGISRGLWIYDLHQGEVFKALSGYCGPASWSQDNGQVAIVKHYGSRYNEIWIAPANALDTGQTLAEHVHKAIELCSQRIEAEPEYAKTYFSRAALYTYLDDEAKAFADLDQYDSLEENPLERSTACSCLAWRLVHIPQHQVNPEIVLKIYQRAQALSPTDQWLRGGNGLLPRRQVAGGC